ncbi:hypothetical protein EMCRGX_G027963 [Ephydatia muelleri]
MAPLHPWEYPRNPWQRLHVDFAGPFCARMWLIVVDARTKWPEVIPMETITTTKTVQALRTIFAHWGLPEQIVSDNGPQFTSEEFKQFCGLNGIRHVLVVPYHPRSNGEAERFVKTFKQAFRSMKGEDLLKRLDQFLFSYRNTPHTTTGYSPAQLLLGRRLRSKLDLLVPREGSIPPVESVVPAESQFTSVVPPRSSSVGELPGVLEIPPKSLSYSASDSSVPPLSSPPGSNVRGSPPVDAVPETTPTRNSSSLTVPSSSPTVPSSAPIGPRRNPQRDRKAPSRYRDFVDH